MQRIATAALAAMLIVPALAGCGSANDTSFCDAAPDDIDVTDPVAMQQALEEIADEAPGEIRDDVDVIIAQLTLMEEDPEAIDVDALGRAVAEISAWEEKNCQASTS